MSNDINYHVEVAAPQKKRPGTEKPSASVGRTTLSSEETPFTLNMGNIKM